MRCTLYGRFHLRCLRALVRVEDIVSLGGAPGKFAAHSPLMRAVPQNHHLPRVNIFSDSKSLKFTGHLVW